MAILINDTAPRAQYTATSGQTVFTVPFEFFVNSDLKVYRNSTLLTLTTNYTVTGAGVTGGGSVTFVTGATAGDIVTIVRDVPVARTSDFPTSGPFNIEALNTDLDRLTAMVQQQETLDGRSLRLDQFDTPNTLNVLPVKASRVGRVLQFNSSTGQPEAGPTTSEIANAQTYATNASTSATAAAASAATSSSAAASTAGSVAAAAASASAASTSASNASTSASNASTSATNAASSASTATTQATNSAASAALANDWATKTSGAVAGGEFSAKYHAQAAATSASNASTSASNAASSASSASAAQTAAESARDATLAAYDSFDDRYLGAKASDPSVDNDGNALVAGALYFNTTDGVMKLYTGSSWVAAYVSGAGFLALSGGTMTGTVNFVAGSAAAPGIAASGDTNTGIFFPAADAIAFAEGGTEVMRLNSSGNVGIGTSSPGSKLEVNQGILTINTSDQSLTRLQLKTTGASGRTYEIVGGLPGTNNSQLSFYDATAAATRMTIDSSGNVGIGQASPGAKLDVSGNIRLSAGNPNIEFNNGGAMVYGPAGNTLAFATGGGPSSPTERFRIGSSGQLGIGGANYGTSGQVLTSQGSGSAPVWASVSGGVTSLTAGNGITVSASTGAVTVSQDIYTGSTANNTSYPIGTCLLTQTGNSGFIVAESRVLVLQNNNASNQGFVPSGTGTSLTGTWRGRGSILDGATSIFGYLYQRTA